MHIDKPGLYDLSDAAYHADAARESSREAEDE